MLVVNIISIGFISGIYTSFQDKEKVFLSGMSQPSILGYSTDNPKDFESTEFDKLTNLIKDTKGNFGLYIYDLTTNKEYIYNEEHEFYAASVFKLYLVTSIYRQIEIGKLNLDDKYKVEETDITGGTGYLQYEKSKDKEYTLLELIGLTLKQSDNTAQNILIRIIDKKYLNEKIFTKDNITTPKLIGNFLLKLSENKYLSPQSTTAILSIISETDFDNRINAGLSPDIVFAHKIGTWPEKDTWHDCGIAINQDKKVIVCLMSMGTEENKFLEIAKKVGVFITNTINSTYKIE